MAKGFELMVMAVGYPPGIILGLKCLDHRTLVWGTELKILPDGRFDTSKLNCYGSHQSIEYVEK